MFSQNNSVPNVLTHWCWVMHICVSKLIIIRSDNGLSPGRHQAIIWTNAGILLIGPLGTKPQWNLNRNLCTFIRENAFENVVCKMATILSRHQYVNSSYQWRRHDFRKSTQRPWQLLHSCIYRITHSFCGANTYAWKNNLCNSPKPNLRLFSKHQEVILFPVGSTSRAISPGTCMYFSGKNWRLFRCTNMFRENTLCL